MWVREIGKLKWEKNKEEEEDRHGWERKLRLKKNLSSANFSNFPTTQLFYYIKVVWREIRI